VNRWWVNFIPGFDTFLGLSGRESGFRLLLGNLLVQTAASRDFFPLRSIFFASGVFARTEE
jgi:hypothetical protein